MENDPVNTTARGSQGMKPAKRPTA